MIARFINYIVSRFSMLSDTQHLISQALENNKTIHERIRKSEPMIKPFILENMSAIVFNDQENDIFLDNFKKIIRKII